MTFLAVHRDRLGRVYGVRLRRAPAVDTLRNLFLALDPAALESSLPAPCPAPRRRPVG